MMTFRMFLMNPHCSIATWIANLFMIMRSIVYTNALTELKERLVGGMGIPAWM